MSNEHVLKIIVFDWVQRVVKELDEKGIAPAPWNTARALAWAAGLLARLEGETVGPVEVAARLVTCGGWPAARAVGPFYHCRGLGPPNHPCDDFSS
jgi:hypothetical protein